jgi:hypothetical protein
VQRVTAYSLYGGSEELSGPRDGQILAVANRSFAGVDSGVPSTMVMFRARYDVWVSAQGAVGSGCARALHEVPFLLGQ